MIELSGIDAGEFEIESVNGVVDYMSVHDGLHVLVRDTQIGCLDFSASSCNSFVESATFALAPGS